MMRQNPDLVKSWLAGVTTFDGQDGLAAINSKIGSGS
jgi:glycine betaine/proline transport system substrate-binding protein